MREDIKKYLFIGAAQDKEHFFQRAQEFGIIHFINPQPKSFQEAPEDVRNVTSAIKVLRGLPPSEQEENFIDLDANVIVEHILSLQEQKGKLEEDMRALGLDIERIHIYGHFSLDDLHYIEKETGKKIQFFSARPSLFQDEPPPENIIYVASDHGMDYYIAFNDLPKTYEKMIEIKIDRSLTDLQEQLKHVKNEHHQIEHDLKKYAKYNDFLHHALIEKLNDYHLYDAQTYVQQTMGGSLFAVEGWVPGNKVKELQELMNNMNIYSEEIAIEPTDVKPTYLENKGFSRLGEDLVHIYDTPSSTDKDPSNWVLYSFVLFFAFIIGDAGYGLVYLAIALLLRYKFPNVKGAGKRFLDLFTLISVGCIVWGVLMTSFFGMQIAVDNPIRKLSLVQRLAEQRVKYDITHKDEAYQEWVKKYPELGKIDNVDEFMRFVPPKDSSKGHVVLQKVVDNTLFELALFIGVIHLVLSLLRYCLRNWAHIGWALFLIGSYFYFSSSLNIPSFVNTIFGVDMATAGKVGFEIMVGGIGLAWILSIIQHGWTGIFEIMTIVQIFADSLSYLRLYALALAGAIVAATVNDMAAGMPIVFAVFLIVISHLVNIVLGTMSGIIHGLRLNYLEWYRWSFEGGGKEFRPLKLLKKD